MKASHTKTKRFVLVAGNIGVGKTSLAERLGEKLDWDTAYKSVVDNPYLADFYADMRAWAFHLQVFFLGHRAEQHRVLAQQARSAILDRSIYEDAEIFPGPVSAWGTSASATTTPIGVSTTWSSPACPCRTCSSTCRRRFPSSWSGSAPVAVRWNSGITAEYLRLLDRYYQEWMAAFDLCPVLTIRTDDLDFVHKAHHLEIVVARMQELLAGKEEVAF